MDEITARWFGQLFCGALPAETVVRVWDCVMFEGVKVLYRVALALLKVSYILWQGTHPYHTSATQLSISKARKEIYSAMSTCRQGLRDVMKEFRTLSGNRELLFCWEQDREAASHLNSPESVCLTAEAGRHCGGQHPKAAQHGVAN